jgi:plasmid maintenance system antidote protein VapI
MSNVTKKVIQSKDGTDIKTFNSLIEAARELAVDHSAISKVVRGIRPLSKGFNFRYEGTEPIILQQKKVPIDTSHDKLKKQVVQSKDEIDIRTFQSVTEAAQFLNVDPSSISRVCRGLRPTYKGFSFRFIKCEGGLETADEKKIIKKRIIQSKDNVDIKTFDSITEAAKAMDCDHGGISQVCRKLKNTCKGFNWRYEE